MAHNRRVGRLDSTHKEIFERAEALGAVVVIFHATPGLKQDKGKPDGFIWHPNCGWQAVEAKGPTTKIRPEQARLAERAPVHVMRCADDMSALIMRKPAAGRVFKIMAEGDVLYIGAASEDDAIKRLRKTYGEIPRHLLTISVVSAGDVPEGDEIL